MQFLKVVSVDGKKVKRKHPFTEKEKEDLQVKQRYGIFVLMDYLKISSDCSIMQSAFLLFLQSRTVVAENLPDDHSHQNLQKIFSVVGRWISSVHPFV